MYDNLVGQLTMWWPAKLVKRQREGVSALWGECLIGFTSADCREVQCIHRIVICQLWWWRMRWPYVTDGWRYQIFGKLPNGLGNLYIFLKSLSKALKKGPKSAIQFFGLKMTPLLLTPLGTSSVLVLPHVPSAFEKWVEILLCNIFGPRFYVVLNYSHLTFDWIFAQVPLQIDPIRFTEWVKAF